MAQQKLQACQRKWQVEGLDWHQAHQGDLHA